MKIVPRKKSRLFRWLLTGICGIKTLTLLFGNPFSSPKTGQLSPSTSTENAVQPTPNSEAKPTMPRTIVLTEAAVQRFEKAILDWWQPIRTPDEPINPSLESIAAALQCDKRTIMKIRKSQGIERGLIVAIFMAQANKPVTDTTPRLWELTEADFKPAEPDSRIETARRLMFEGGELYQGANYPAAEARYREALRLFQAAGERSGEATTHQAMGRLLLAEGKFREAHEHVSCAFSLTTDGKDHWLEADLHELNGVLYQREGKLEESRAHFLRCLAIWKAEKHLHSTADAELNLVGLETEAGRAKPARAHLENARKIIENTKEAPMLASLLLREARLLLLEGNPEAATKSAKQALEFWTFAKHPRWKALSHLVLAEIAHVQHHTEDVTHHAELSLALYTEVGDRYGISSARTLLR